MRTTPASPAIEPDEARFAAPTLSDIREAEELRRLIRERYLAAAQPRSDPYWCLGAD
jgi:hypothetical protein